MRAGPSEQRERSTPTARNARRGARQITALILTTALIIEPIHGAVRRPGPDAGWTGETVRRLHAVQAERKLEPETLAPKASPWRASPGAISAGGAPRPGGVSVEGNGGTKGALAGFASGVVSGALTYAVGAYGGGLLGDAAQSIGINVNAGYTFEGGWTGGVGFNFAGLGGQRLGFGANIQLAEGGRQTGGGVDLSFGRGGARSSVSFSNDGTARLGYTTAGSGPQNNLRGNFGVTLDKDGIAGVDASASYTGYHGGSLFGQGTSTTLTNNAGLFYNRDGSYGITTSTNIGIADAYGFGLNRVGANTNERYTWGRGGGFQGTTQNITAEIGFQSKEQALENIRKRTNEVYALLEKGNPSPEEEAALREELQFLKQRDAQADPWTAMYNTVMTRTDIPQSVKDEIRKNPDLLLDHDYMAAMLKSVGGGTPSGTTQSRTGILDNLTGAISDAADWLVGDSSSDLGYVDEDGKFVYRTCFVAGTLVAVPGGFKPIEEIKVGDTVLSWNEKRNAVELRRVAETFQREADRIYTLRYSNGETIQTTWNHEFYIEGQGWIEARRLRAGDVSKTASGSPVAITNVSVDYRSTPVYNFEVEETHTYFVSETVVLVHNEAGCGPMFGGLRTTLAEREAHLARRHGLQGDQLREVAQQANRAGEHALAIEMQRLTGRITDAEAAQQLKALYEGKHPAVREAAEDGAKAGAAFAYAGAGSATVPLALGCALGGCQAAGAWAGAAALARFPGLARILGMAPPAAAGAGAAAGGAILAANARQFVTTERLTGNVATRRVAEIAASMRQSGWQGPPIAVVEHNGIRYVLDGHHRVAAAAQAGIHVQYRIVQSTDLAKYGYATLRDVLMAAAEAGGR